MSKLGAFQQSDAVKEIYKVKYTHHAPQFNKGIPGTCITAKCELG